MKVYKETYSNGFQIQTFWGHIEFNQYIFTYDLTAGTAYTKLYKYLGGH